MRNGWNPSRLACSSATSVWTWLIAFAPSMTTAVLHDRNLYGGSALFWLMTALVGALAAGLVLGIAHLLMRARRSVVIVLVVFLLAGAVRGLGVGWTAHALGLVVDPQFVVRAASGAILALFWLSIATLIVDGYRTHRVTRLDVQERQRAVERALNLSTHQLQTTREQMRIDVVPRMRILIAQLRELPSSAVAAAAGLTVIATNIHDLSSDVVRPLSHAVSSPPVHPAQERPRTRWAATRLIVSDAFTVSPFRPGWLIALLFSAILMTAIRAYGAFWGVAGAVWIALMGALVVGWGKRIFTPHLKNMPVALRGVVVVGVWMLAGLAASLPVALSNSWEISPERAWAVFGVPLLAYVPMTCLGIAIVTAISQSWAMDTDAREALIASLEWRHRQLLLTLWAERTRLGRFLHGSVQSTLTSTALGIETGLHIGTPPATLADQAVERLSDLLGEGDVLDADSERVMNPADLLTRIAAIWSRVSTISINIDTSADTSMTHDSSAAEATVEIVREAIANAIRHGHARNITVNVAHSDPRHLSVTVFDDGSLSKSAQPGLGSAILDELCSEWERRSVHSEGTMLRCVVPILSDAAMVEAD